MNNREIRCESCKYGTWCPALGGYTCKNPGVKDVTIFKGKTHPHCCPLVGGKKYGLHGNINSGVRGLRSFSKAGGYYDCRRGFGKNGKIP